MGLISMKEIAKSQNLKTHKSNKREKGLGVGRGGSRTSICGTISKGQTFRYWSLTKKPEAGAKGTMK